jgi:hypothetical protein
MECITLSYGLVRGAAKNYPYHQPARYESRVTRDGRTVWSYVGHCGLARRSSRLAIRDAQALAASLGIEYRDYVRHNHAATV